MHRTIELNEEEMDWLDEGHSFCALWDFAKKEYDNLSYAIMLKIRKAYNKIDTKDERKYRISLIKEEIDYLFEKMKDMLADDYNWMIEDLKNVLSEYREERISDFKEQLAITNRILKKLEKPLQTFESLEKYLKELETSEDEEEYTTKITIQDVIAYDTKTYKGSCRLIVRSDGKVKHIYKPSFDDCLSFLFYNASKTGIWRLFFNLDFNMSAILKRWNNKEKINKLKDGETIDYKQWNLTWMKGCMFIMKKGRKVVHYIDLSNIFHSPLQNASEKYLHNESNINVDDNKLNTSLSYWDNKLTSIIESCIKDCVLTKKLGLILLEHLRKEKVELPKALIRYNSLSKQTLKSLEKYLKNLVDSKNNEDQILSETK